MREGLLGILSAATPTLSHRGQRRRSGAHGICCLLATQSKKSIDRIDKIISIPFLTLLFRGVEAECFQRRIGVPAPRNFNISLHLQYNYTFT